MIEGDVAEVVKRCWRASRDWDVSRDNDILD